MYKSLVSVLFILSISSAEPDINLPFERDISLFGVSVNRGGSQVPKNNAVKPEVKGIRRQDDFEEAEQHFFDVVERAEKKVLNVAANLMHDEVDILFGKDHGHPIHDVHDDPKEVQEKVVREKQAPVWHL